MRSILTIYCQIRKKLEILKALKIYGNYYLRKKKVFINILAYYKKLNIPVAIWGGGLKGIAFLSVIDPDYKWIHYVFDIDKSKYNSFLPFGHPIVNFRLMNNNDVGIVLIMNNNYETEIAGLLHEANLHPILINIDSIICGNLTTKNAIHLYNKRVE